MIDAFAHWQRAHQAFTQASRVALKTGDPRHRRHAKVLHEIALEKFRVWRAEMALQRVIDDERRHPGR